MRRTATRLLISMELMATEYVATMLTSNDDSYESKYEITIQRSEIEDFGRIGEDAKLYGAEVQTSIDD